MVDSNTLNTDAAAKKPTLFRIWSFSNIYTANMQRAKQAASQLAAGISRRLPVTVSTMLTTW